MRISRISFQNKFTMLVMLTTTLALLVAGAGFAVLDAITARDAIAGHLRTIADYVGSACTAALRFGDAQTAMDTLRIMEGDPRIVVAAVITEDGEVFARYVRHGASGAIPPLDNTDACAFTPENVRLGHRIIWQEEQLGWVYIQRDLADIHKRLRVDVAFIGLMLLVSFILATVTATRFQRVLTAPLNELLHVTQSVRRTRDFSRLKLSEDELGYLTDQFNNMLGEIQRRETDLSRAHADLERKVNERTRELGDQRTAALNMMEDAQEARQTAEQARESLRHTADELARSNRELEQFAYVASHDLQEPLRKITAFGNLLETELQGLLTEDSQKYLEIMQNAARRMSQLISDLLHYSRVMTRAQPYESVSLNGVVEEVLSDLELRIRETDAHVRVEPLPTLDADRTQMRQLFQNLIGNAIKFRRDTEPPRVHVFTAAPPADEEKAATPVPTGFCRIVVEDNGIGFEDKHADRIFGIFQRLHGRLEYEGSGIGLAVCRRIVERHGGSILAHASPEAGARFTIDLPLHHVEGEEMTDEASRDETRSPAHG